MTNKNRISLIIMSALTFIILGFPNPENLNSKIMSNVPSDYSEDELRAVVIEDFETPSNWTIEAIPKKNQDPKKDPVPELEIRIVDAAPSDMSPQKWSENKKGLEAKKCLGIHFRFKYPGYNAIHLIPPPETQWDEPGTKVLSYDTVTGKEVQENALQVPGHAKGISAWVHGRGNDYYLECWIKDWRGEVHILKFGSINFVGWRPLKAEIPPYVPQEIESYPQTKILKILRFVLRSSPDASIEDTYVFIDQIKVLTDVYEINFDGSDLHKLFEKGSQTQGTQSQGTKK